MSDANDDVQNYALAVLAGVVALAGLALVLVMLLRPSGIWPVRHKEVKA